jgi:hypothetical protein
VAGSTSQAAIEDGSGQIRIEGYLELPATFILPTVVDASAIPTADPHVAGQVWANSHVLTVSSG